MRSAARRLALSSPARCTISAPRRGAPGKRSAAREPLREALALAQQCGAVLLAARIERELEATGVHLRRDRSSGREALTPAERRVAELAASGLTNREIGQTLFVSVKTVGTHLGHIYEKLDLQGPQAREQLGELLSPNGIAAVDQADTLDGAQRG